MEISAKSSSQSQIEWLRRLCEIQPVAARLLVKNEEEQCRLGYFHTFREICQQPETWLHTSELMQEYSAELSSVINGLSSLTLSGSGSSEYAGGCVCTQLRRNLGINVQAVGAGAVLTHGIHALPVGTPSLMVSLARSGDSPESVGALVLLRRLEPEMRHLVLTCNREGRLANTFRTDPKVTVITLDDCTNDRSLVMTSSFTNMVLGAQFLGLLSDPARYKAIASALAVAGSALLQDQMSAFEQVARKPFRRTLFLGSGARFAAAKEASLKMVEMTAGRVTTTCETFLGLRHGPMSGIDDQTLIVCFLSTDPMVRAYETDVVRELAQKELGLVRILAGQNVPDDLPAPGDTVVRYRSTNLADEDLPILDVVVGQLLAFFRCLGEGLRPDSPSGNGIIRRVVPAFTLHLPKG